MFNEDAQLASRELDFDADDTATRASAEDQPDVRIP